MDMTVTVGWCMIPAGMTLVSVCWVLFGKGFLAGGNHGHIGNTLLGLLDLLVILALTIICLIAWLVWALLN